MLSSLWFALHKSVNCRSPHSLTDLHLDVGDWYAESSVAVQHDDAHRSPSGLAVEQNRQQTTALELFIAGWPVRGLVDRQCHSLYGLHSLRRTFPTHIYQQTGNLRAAQLLLGHASIESTKDYIGTEQAEALEIARKYHL